MMVPVEAVGGLEPGYLAVGAIEDHVLAWCFSPGQHGPAAVVLHLEVHHAPRLALQVTKPHYLSTIVDDHRAALSSATLLRSDEGVAGCCVVRLRGYLDGRWAEVRS